MAAYLPSDAVVWGYVDQKLRWTDSEHLNASILDEIRLLRWTLASMFSKTKIPQPDAIPRPGVKRGALPGIEIVKPTETFETPDAFLQWRNARLNS